MAVRLKEGLRERKKRRTREAIVDTAWRLFLDRGFEGVTVAEIAQEAEVSEATVFNYFGTKEDLAYFRMEDFEEEMLQSIRERTPGTSIADAFGRFVLKPRGFLSGDDIDVDMVVRVTKLFTESPALMAREREIFDRYERKLGEAIASERRAKRDDLESHVIAKALVSLHRAMVEHVRHEVLAGRDTKRIAQQLEERGSRAVALIKYGVERASTDEPTPPTGRSRSDR
jgi:AcrR family transcriptional regulator